mmetsp:Transcript_4433/g.10000  ORF Transcript_4433/g.10000 Transcript_4433/m.10000 type:complete len:231 (-) Transcript_4433:206-898(-)
MVQILSALSLAKQDTLDWLPAPQEYSGKGLLRQFFMCRAPQEASQEGLAPELPTALQFSVSNLRCSCFFPSLPQDLPTTTLPPSGRVAHLHHSKSAVLSLGAASLCTTWSAHSTGSNSGSGGPWAPEWPCGTLSVNGLATNSDQVTCATLAVVPDPPLLPGLGRVASRRLAMCSGSTTGSASTPGTTTFRISLLAGWSRCETAAAVPLRKPLEASDGSADESVTGVNVPR